MGRKAGSRRFFSEAEDRASYVKARRKRIRKDA